MKPINVQIVAHVVKWGPCGFIELYDLFGASKDADGSKNALERFRSKLNHLTYSGQLVGTGTHHTRRWHAPLQNANPAPAQDNNAEQAPWVGVVVPPAQHDVMHAPAYVPESGPVLRSGSQDFKRYASFGDRC